MLKPQDIVVLIKLAIESGRTWSYTQLAYELSMSASEIHAGIKRATQARLFSKQLNRPHRKALEEFLIHGVKYAYSPTIGSLIRGIPTAFASPVLRDHFALNDDSEIYVWPHPEGEYRGLELSPLYKSVPDTAIRDNKLYAAFSLLDAIRIGRAREINIAEKLLLEMINNASS
ncbi:MAG: hypothetical protein RBR35_11275 [Salinivirgaceae bacterium]|nr:hypothetical protein [Salinivirgaceae bacterium]